MDPKDYERVDVPIVCHRCHDPHTYTMLRKYSETRQTCIYGNICNVCLTTDERRDLIVILGCEESVVTGNNKPGDCDNLIKQK